MAFLKRRERISTDDEVGLEEEVEKKEEGVSRVVSGAIYP